MPSLPFTLSFLDGKGVLGLRGPTAWDLIGVEKIELEIPNLRFPFDHSGGAARFQNRRCRFREARLVVDEGRLERWLSSRRLADYGIEELRIRLGDGEAIFSFTARVGDRRATATARAWIERADGQDVRIIVGDVRVYGFLPVAAPLMGLALLLGAGAKREANGEPRVSLRGVAELVCNPLDLVLWQTLPPNGWRLPAYQRARLSAVRITRGKLELDYHEAAAERAPSAPRSAALQLCPDGEELLARNELEAALAAFQAAAAASEDPQPHLVERIITVLAMLPSRRGEAMANALAATRVAPRAAELVLAAMACERGDGADAARRYAGLAQAAEAAGQPEDAAAAAMRAAELYLGEGGDPPAATPLLERVLAAASREARGGPRDPSRAAALLAARYVEDQRWDDLAKLERRRIALAPDPVSQAQGHLRLARVWLERLGDSGRARDELERAVRLHALDMESWSMLAEACHATGDRSRALRAIDRVVELSNDDVEAAAAAHLRGARWLLEEPSDHERALSRVRAAQAFTPESADPLLAEARLLVAMGDVAGGDAALDRALAAVPADNEEMRHALLVEWAEAARQRGDFGAACRHLERALGLGNDREVLRELTDLAGTTGSDEGRLDETLSRLAAQFRTSDPGAAARALAAQGAARLRRERLTDAFDSYRAASELSLGEDDEICGGLGEVAWQLRRWDEARAALEPLHRRQIEPRVERALRLGQIAERQRDVDAAVRFYRDVLAAGARGNDAVRAHDALVRLEESRGDVEAATRAQITAVDDTHSGEAEAARAERLVEAALLLRRHGGKDEPQALADRALALDAQHLGALDVLEGLARQASDFPRVVAILERKVDATRARPAEQKAILARLGALQAESLRDSEAARSSFQRALALDPDHRPSLLWLADEARQRGIAEIEVELLGRVAALPPDPIPEQDIVVHARLAELHSAAGRDREAERSARRTLALAPRHAGALAILDELLTRAGRRDELLAVLSRRAEVEHDEDLSLELLFRRAELLDALGRRDDAGAAYEQIVHRRPISTAAWERLVELRRESGAWTELIDVLGRIAELRAGEGRRGEAAAIAAEMAHLAHDRLSDAKRARALLERALSWDPRSTLALDGLLALARAAGDQAAEDEWLGRRIAAEEQAGRRDQLTVERARLKRDRLDLDAALALLSALPVESAAAEALELRVELAEGVRDFKNAAVALEERVRRAREAADVPGERDAVRRLAQIAWRELKHGRTAEALYRRALELDPTDVSAAAALAELEKDRGDPVSYLEALERLLRALRRGFEEPRREADVCIEIGRVLRAAGDPTEASARLREALEADPDRAEALLLLGETLLDRGETSEAVRVLERAIDLEPDRAHQLLERARRQAGPSSETTRSVVADVPRPLPLEKTSVGEREVPRPLDDDARRRLYRAGGRWHELVADLDREIALATGPARLRHEVEAAEVVEKQLGDTAEAAVRYARAFERDPSQRALGARARGLFLVAGDHVRALNLLEREIDATPPAEATALRVQRAELLLARGSPIDITDASAELERALSVDGRLGVAHAALGELRLRLGDSEGALPHLVAAVDAPDVDPHRATACALAAASYLEVRGDDAQVERLYSAAARLDPVDERPVLGLIAQAFRRREFDRVVELQARAIALVGDRRARARLWLDRARVFQDELKRESDAHRSLKEAVSNDAELLEAVTLLRRSAAIRGEWPLAVELLHREISAADLATRATLHAELGRLYEEHLFDPHQALRSYEEASALGAPVNHELSRLYQVASRPGEAADAMLRHAAGLSGEARVEAVLAAADQYRRAGRPTVAERLLNDLSTGSDRLAREAQAALLRLADDRDDPASLRVALEQQLRNEPEGEQKLELLRRLLTVASRLKDDQAAEYYAQAVQSRAPDDTLAFVELKRLFTERDDPKLADLLRARATSCNDPEEATERRFEAGRLSEQNGDEAQAAADYHAALSINPDHLGALDSLADLAYQRREVARARELYARLADRPSRLGADEVWKRRGELAEADADWTEAARHYQHAVGANPSLIAAHEALARLAVRRDDPGATYTALKAVLDLLPLDAVERITELRQRLGDQALRLGETHAARNYYELVLAQDPERVEALSPLADLYSSAGEWELCADALGRLSYLAKEPLQRATLIFRQAEIYRLRLDQIERANAGYLKAADLAPSHQPTLRRLIAYYLAECDGDSVREVVSELELQGAPLEDVSVESGLGLALAGEENRAQRYLRGTDPARLATALSTMRVRDVAQLDRSLNATLRALNDDPDGDGDGAEGHERLARRLDGRLVHWPSDLGARMVRARLAEHQGELPRAQAHYVVLAWVDPAGAAASHLATLATVVRMAHDTMSPPPRSPLRDALRVLGPLTLGLVAPRPGAEPIYTWPVNISDIAAVLGFTDVSGAILDEMLEPAWAEPTAPPRVLVRRALLGDGPALRFAVTRALLLLRAGASLVQWPAEDVSALLAAAATLFNAGELPTAPFSRAWLAELRSLPLRPETLAPAERQAAANALTEAVAEGALSERIDEFLAHARAAADRRALALTGNLAAALRCLAPPTDGPAARATALATLPSLRILVEYATG